MPLIRDFEQGPSGEQQQRIEIALHRRFGAERVPHESERHRRVAADRIDAGFGDIRRRPAARRRAENR